MTRHPAHHLEAGKPFWKLRPYEDALNCLPAITAAGVALIPPLARADSPRMPSQHGWS